VTKPALRLRRRAVLSARKLVDVAPPRLSLAVVDLIENRTGEADLKLLPALVPPDAVAGDVGANRGVYSRRLARLCRQVIAFEPQPDLARRLVRATADNVVVLPVALSGTAGRATLRIPLVGNVAADTRATLGLGAEGPCTEVSVLLLRLDDLALPSLGFLKVDVEGHEMDLLDGGMETIERCRPRLLIECDAETGSHPGEVADRLAPIRYEGWFHFDGDIVPVEKFAAEVHQSQRKEFGGPRPAAQATNFIFLPSDEAGDILGALRTLARS
jgi:FkbM family methyltransferase